MIRFNKWNTLFALIVASYFVSKYFDIGSKIAEGFSCNDQTMYTSYFTPWWRNYAKGPYDGTSYNQFNSLAKFPYRDYWKQPWDYNYWSYWKKPAYYNYGRQPYSYRRPVYRPYVQDSILGRRNRMDVYNF